MDLDAPTVPDGLTVSADVCIVGAGPAGLVLASLLQKAGREVVLLESGALAGGAATAWNTMVGGTAHAKLLPLDHIDFERREWIPESGWPFQGDELAPWYAGAREWCGIEDPATVTGRGGPMLTFPARGLRNTWYDFAPAERFSGDLPRELGASSRVTLLRGARVTALEQAPGGGRLAAVTWTSESGRRGTARAARFVLAAGGVENVRILLANDFSAPWLGRGYMEHPVDGSLELLTDSPALSPDSGGYAFPRDSARPVRMGRIGCTPELLRAERLPNASVRFVAEAEPPLLSAPNLRPAARWLVPFRPARRLVGGAIRSLSSITRRWRPARYRMLLDLEQVPHPDNRIVLTDRRDAGGVLEAALHWRWRAEDQAALERLRAVVVREIERASRGRVTAAPIPLDPVTYHQLGGTRMHTDPSRGVVDQHLRVHGMENLWVTGSSVFPTGGCANPTLTILALTLRLGDRLIRMA